jgi:copper(I)-binding protein
MHFKQHRPALVSLPVALMLAFTALAQQAAIVATPPVHVENSWIRWLPANLPAAGYATLVNNGDRPEVLIGADSPAYGEVTLHQNVAREGTVQMRPVERITLDPHSSLRFADAGYHMMLMQPTKALKPGDRVPIALRFLSGIVTAQFEVRAIDSSAPP